MKLKTSSTFLILLMTCSLSDAAPPAARRLAHPELVKRYVVSTSLIKDKLASCAGKMSSDTDCWAAGVADKLRVKSDAIKSFVLDDQQRDDRLTACARLAVDQRVNAADCLAAAQADTFIAQVNPRTRLGLAPLKHF